MIFMFCVEVISGCCVYNTSGDGVELFVCPLKPDTAQQPTLLHRIRKSFISRNIFTVILQCIQWNLRIMDTFGMSILSVVQRLSLLWR